MTSRLVWLILILILIPVAAVGWVWLLLAAMAHPTGRRAAELGEAWDQVANAAVGGDADMTLSAHAGKVLEKRADSGRFPPRWAFWLCRLFDKLDPGHCAKSWAAYQQNRGSD